MLEQLTYHSFGPYLDQTFHVKSGEDTLELTLLEAVPIGSAPQDGKRHPFSVVFLGPAEPILPQRIYDLEHAEMGKLSLFLVPLGPDRTARGMRYEAVFT
jgi:hypothetical protein